MSTAWLLKSKDVIAQYGIVYCLKKILSKVGLYQIDIADQYRIEKYYKAFTLDEASKALENWYRENMGENLNLNHPVKFTEKIQWLKLYDQNPLKAELCDKHLAPAYVKKMCGEILHVVHQLGCWNRGEDIDFTTLPDKFVLKCNHGSGMNIIVKDKGKLDHRKAVKQLNRWLKVNFAYVGGGFELQYDGVVRKIIAEEYISEMNGNLHDIKIHCFHGKPGLVQVIGDRDYLNHTGKQVFYDENWNRLDMNFGDYPLYVDDIPKPKSFDRMLEASRILSKEFKYVRVDLYEIYEEPYFGEMTFTPASGLYPFMTPESMNQQLGNKIDLER